MITATLSEFFEGLEMAGSHIVYLVRDGDLVIYVGKTTTGAGNRLLSHCGRGPWGWSSGPDNLGRLITQNSPESDPWQVDIYRVEDCLSELKTAYPYFVHFDLDILERYLIKKYSPCLNGTYNPNPTRLPPKYYRQDE